MQHIYRYRFPPLGFLWLAAWEGGVLTHVAFEGGDQPLKGQNGAHAPASRNCQAVGRIFRRQAANIRLAFAADGHPVQNQVWREVMAIPYGQTRQL